LTGAFDLPGSHPGGVREVQEGIRYQEMTRLPLAASVVRGLINLRGQIVTAIDLRRRLGRSRRCVGEAGA
jgi:purine-binding chemotaxis protein CheW